MAQSKMSALLFLFAILCGVATAIPSPPLYFANQKVDHFSTNTATFIQRYYENCTAFGGPGSPIFVILGG
jgi:hypothetical protein